MKDIRKYQEYREFIAKKKKNIEELFSNSNINKQYAFPRDDSL